MDDCVFCKIAKGLLPATVVHRNEKFLAFEDVQPRADHHLLVIPCEHHGDLDAWVAAGGSSQEMLEFVSAAAAERGIAGRYRLITNVGPDAGQVVFHLHWHVLAGERLPGF